MSSLTPDEIELVLPIPKKYTPLCGETIKPFCDSIYIFI